MLFGRQGNGTLDVCLSPKNRFNDFLGALVHDVVVISLQANSDLLRRGHCLAEDLGNSTCTNGAATLTDSESKTFVHSDRVDQLDRHVSIVTGHAHFCA